MNLMLTTLKKRSSVHATVVLSIKPIRKHCPMKSRSHYTARKEQSEPLFKPRDSVCLHNTHSKKEQAPCQIVECLAKPVENLNIHCCMNGVLTGIYLETDLTKSTSSHFIEMMNETKIILQAARSNPHNLRKCECERPLINREIINLSDLGESQQEETNTVWNWKSIVCPTWKGSWTHHLFLWIAKRWDYPRVPAATYPTVSTHQWSWATHTWTNHGFQAHGGDFVQILPVRNNH